MNENSGKRSHSYQLQTEVYAIKYEIRIQTIFFFLRELTAGLLPDMQASLCSNLVAGQFGGGVGSTVTWIGGRKASRRPWKHLSHNGFPDKKGS